MKKFPSVIGLVTVLIILSGVWFLTKNSVSPAKLYPLPPNLEYFWGQGCPHCANVESFLETWNKKEQVKIDKKEVRQNAANAAEMQARYEFCQIPPNQMGVPLLFTPQGKCYTGDSPIINYLKSL